MREWPENHPKAKAMAKRRRQIIDAAKLCFVRTGYAGTTMEAVADAAGISLMTLYRFAEGKEDLFAVAISDACRARDEDEREYYEGLVYLPVRELLMSNAVQMRMKILHADSIALMRLVIAEAVSFPNLLPLAYKAFLEHFETLASQVIRIGFPEDSGDVDALSRIYVDCLLGADVLRMLLGDNRPPDAHDLAKAQLATDTVLNLMAVRSGS
ncbi:TetR/AcrR family transcriptional regulator [Allorhizobium sp. BGMRC 0089]|uniref:TetR/AcrR family transcriptional regulator n=1 Tax=Allorhizobium sonneratiae TaxID=2934936 RepID=UPI0020335D58|nr:TetR/AcrR family transcriptional regulator [Allorhizobium sonneratiae]MCM2292540.1 TetR/AcrR family transcriptional regulator [Allorhizobium sonneratiae]